MQKEIANSKTSGQQESLNKLFLYQMPDLILAHLAIL